MYYLHIIYVIFKYMRNRSFYAFTIDVLKLFHIKRKIL